MINVELSMKVLATTATAPPGEFWTTTLLLINVLFLNEVTKLVNAAAPPSF